MGRVSFPALRTLVWGLTVISSVVAAGAQTTEPDIAARLQGHPLFLRGMGGVDKQAFDVAGVPKKSYPAAAFTECGIDVTDVRLKGNRLEIEGQRVGLTFSENGEMRRVPIESKAYKGKIKIEIDGAPNTDYGKALDAVFAPSLESLVPSLPDYWQSYAHQHFLRATETGGGTEKVLTAEEVKEANKDWALEAGANRVGHDVNPPRVLYSRDASFSKMARAVKYSGTVQVYLWVLEDGTPSHLKIVKPAGMGLDDAAVMAVRTYRFAPATRAGQPIKVELYIDVKFDIY